VVSVASGDHVTPTFEHDRARALFEIETGVRRPPAHRHHEIADTFARYGVKP